MASRSSIEKLPPELKIKLLQLLQDPNVTQAQVAEAVNSQAGFNVVSKSAVNRYSQKMEHFAERNRQAQAVAQLYLDKVGEDTTNKLGRVANEQIRLLVYDLVGELDELRQSADIKPQQVADIVYKVSRGMRELELASKLSVERERQIREEALSKAADTAAEKGKMAGLSVEAAEQIRLQVLGSV